MATEENVKLGEDGYRKWKILSFQIAKHVGKSHIIVVAIAIALGML